MNRAELEQALVNYPVSLTITMVGEIVGLERQSVTVLLEKKILDSYVINPDSKRKRYRVLKAHVIDYILKNANGEQE